MFPEEKPPEVYIHLPCTDGSRFTREPTRSHGESSDALGTIAAPSNALDDVTSKEDAAIMGDLIFQLMAGFTADPDTEVHLSLAGGRKTMSAHALLAMTLLGRVQDEASHVLVSPPRFEGHPHFWFPYQGGPPLETRDGTRLDPKEAVVTLIPTPTPLVRHEIKAKDAAAIARLSLVEIVRRYNLDTKLKADPYVIVDSRYNTIALLRNVEDRVSVRLNPVPFALYRLAATAKRDGWVGVGPDGEGSGHSGWLSVPQICSGKTPSRERIDFVYHRFLSEAVQMCGGEPEKDESVFGWLWNVAKETNQSKKLNCAKDRIQPAKSRLTAALRKAVGGPAISIIGLRYNEGRQQEPSKGGQTLRLADAPSFGLVLPPEAIEII